MKALTIATTIIAVSATAQSVMSQTVDILYTTDVHGAFLNYDFIKDEPCANGLEAVYTAVSEIRKEATSTLFLDGGDIMQGTPLAYYSNCIDTLSTNIAAQVYNFMGYDAVCVGNHDIETTHKVYDKAFSQFDMPVLCANVLNTATGKPYFEPYTVFKRGGKRIAVIGLTTPYTPHWLEESYWSGMLFQDMIKSARQWVSYVKEHEKPDAIIGVFHAGTEAAHGGQDPNAEMNENASLLVAEQVEGFDLIFTGHDHQVHNIDAKTPSGKTIKVVGTGKLAYSLAHVSMSFDKDGNIQTEARIIPMDKYKPSEAMHNRFASIESQVKDYTRRVICKLAKPIESYDALMGSSPFADLVSKTMLKHTGADICMSAPLSVKAVIPAGELTVGRMFSIYPFENTLCVLRLTGEEILNYMEFSYDMWIENPKETGHVLRLKRKGRLLYDFFALDSALGIDYTVDVTKPKGQRISIKKLSDGRRFDKKKSYTVAMNSYRGNGGNGHLELGAGIPFDSIKGRIVKVINRDIRGLLIEDLSDMGKDGKSLILKPTGNWRFVPEKEVKKAFVTDIEGFVSK